MIIRTYVPPKKFPTPVVEIKPVEKDEEVIVKPVDKTVKEGEVTSVYEPVIEESEDEDLSQWLEGALED